MANSTTIQVLHDGPRNCILKFEGVLDTSDQALMIVADPALLGGMDSSLTRKATALKLARVEYNVEDGLSLNLFWDGGTPARIAELTGRGDLGCERIGSIPNNAGTPNGKLTATTEGWSGIKSFVAIIELTKVGT